jgi:hypothetical protein
MIDSKTRERITQAIKDGRLPRHRPARLWGGSGTGRPCPACAEPVQVTEVGFELPPTGPIAVGAPPPEEENFLHQRCLAIWDEVIRELNAGKS